MIIKENISLLPYNTFGIDVKSDYFIEYNSIDDLREILRLDIIKSKPVLMAGEGSNLLFLNDYKGIVLRSNINFIDIIKEEDNNIWIEVGSGVIWDNLVAQAVQNRWYGTENLSLIPGQTGAASVQNIGAYGVEIKDIIDSVKTIEISTGKQRIFTQQECDYEYRDSIFKNKYKGKYIVTSIILKLSKTPVYCFDYMHLEKLVKQKGEINLDNIRNTIIETREQKLPDPKIEGNAGSFFKNPVISAEKLDLLIKQYPAIPNYPAPNSMKKLSAAWLIDQSGWKGKTVGNVGVHDKQPLVLVNKGNCTGAEVAHLASLIQKSVKDKFGVELHPEVNFI